MAKPVAKLVTKPPLKHPVLKRPLEDVKYTSRVHDRADHVTHWPTTKPDQTRVHIPGAMKANSKITAVAKPTVTNPQR